MKERCSRRGFLLHGSSMMAAAAAIPYWCGSPLARGQEPRSANDRIRWGALGTGDRWGSLGDDSQVSGVGGEALRFGDFVAVCDVDAFRRERASYLLGGKADRYEDYQRVLDRKDVDAVTITTPDHWHTPMAIAALRAGKDVYCEKPLTLTVQEGQHICKVVRETGRVFQVGTQQRSEFGLRFLQAVALVRAGRVGQVQRVTVAIGTGPTCDPLPLVEPPRYLNWDKWLGQAPFEEYRYQKAAGRAFGLSRCHYEFRWWYDYSGGKLTDWGAHHVDIAHWAMGLEDTGPLRIEPLEFQLGTPFEKGYPVRDDQYNTPVTFKIRCTFANGMELIIRDQAADLGFENGILIEGDQGKLFVNRERISGQCVDDLVDNPLPEEALRTLYKGKQPGDHMGNFVQCLRTREEPISDVFSHHRAMTTCHLANIAMRLNRNLEWDPVAEVIQGDEEASSFLARTARPGYEISM